MNTVTIFIRAAFLCVLTAVSASADVKLFAEENELQFFADFPGAAVGNVKKDADTDSEVPVYRIEMPCQSDEKGLNSQRTWFSFRVECVKKNANDTNDLASDSDENGEKNDNKNGEKNGNGTDCENRDGKRSGVGNFRLIFYGFDGVYNGHPTRPNWQGQRMVFRIPANGGNSGEWKLVPEECVTWDSDARTLTLHDFQPGSAVFWLAYTETFTLENLNEVVNRLKMQNTHDLRVKIEVIGKTLEGRDIQRFTITDFSVPDTEKKHFYIMARQHAWEALTSWQAVGLIQFLTGADASLDGNAAGVNPENVPDVLPGERGLSAAEICKKAVFHIVPVVDADGVQNGKIRFNGNGYDVNRRWNEVNAEREKDSMRTLRPEVWYVKHDILHLNAIHPLTCAVNLHGDTNTDYIDAAGNPERDWGKFRAFDAAFSATEYYDPNENHPITIFEHESDAVPTTFDLWWNHGIPTIMMEQKVIMNRKTGRFPTAKSSMKRGEMLGRILYESF